MSLSDVPGPGLRDVASLPVTASPRDAEDTELAGLQARFLRAGREAVDDRELLQLLLAGSHPAAEARELAEILLDTFESPARVLAARTDTLRAIAGLGEAGIAAVKTAEALGIAMARAALPENFHPQLETYEKVVEYCRTLAAHRDVEEFRLLYLDTKNRAHPRRAAAHRHDQPHPGLSPPGLRPRARGGRRRPGRPAPAPVERSDSVKGGR